MSVTIPGYRGELPWLASRTVFLTRHGSHAYGLASPESDLDLRGVAVAPRVYYHGFSQRFEQAEASEPDLVIYELRKFVKLAADANPSVLELLFTDPSDHLEVTPLGAKIIAAREAFLSRKVKHTFSGFAMAQMKRLEASRKYIVAPPSGPDAPGWAGYEQWKSQRNPKRAALESAHGYDTKFGAHVVRLLRMCREVLTTGEVRVKRPDADELRAIRGGAWPFERLAAFAKAEDEALTALAASSGLPHGPDLHRLDALCMAWLEEGLATLPE